MYSKTNIDQAENTCAEKLAGQSMTHWANTLLLAQVWKHKPVAYLENAFHACQTYSQNLHLHDCT